MTDRSVDHQYQEVSCQRGDLSYNAFVGGLQDFPFNIPNKTVWYPSKSYMRFKVLVSGLANAHLRQDAATVAVPKIHQQIALAEGFVANCYNNAKLMAGGRELSSITSCFPQASAIEARTTHSGAWLDRVGAYTQSYNGDRSSRVAAISNTAAAGNLAPVGFNLAEGKQEIYRPTDGTAPDDAKLEGKAAQQGFTMTGGALITAADVGSTLVVEGVKYTVLGIVGGLVNVGVAFNVAAAGPPAVAGNVVANTANWYLVRRNSRYSTQARNVVQVLWAPTALGAFRWQSHMPPGKYQLSLNPDPNYQLTAVEYPYGTSTGFGPLTAASAAYSMAILDVKLYIATAKMEIPASLSRIDMTEFQCRAQTMTSNSGDFSWTVPASTRALYVFLQDSTSGSNPVIPPNVFRVNGVIQTGTPTVLPTGTGCEQNLTGIQITYAGITKPPNQWVSGFVAGTNMLTQLYTQYLIDTDREHSGGGAETMDQWLQRGPLMAWRFERDSGDRSTLVSTNVTYTDAGGVAWPPGGCKLFLCAEYERYAVITNEGSEIIDVVADNV